MNNNIKDYVKKQLGSNAKWATRAIVRLYEQQTRDEQTSMMTNNNNSVGFNSVDALILSSFAQQIMNGRTLSAKQLTIAFKKLPKYAGQVAGFINEYKQSQLEAKIST